MVTPPPVTAVRRAVETALVEDLEPLGDVSAALIDPAVTASARFVSREVGVLSGTWAATETVVQVGAGLTLVWDVDEGAALDAQTQVGVISGPLAAVLSAERTALNFLGRMSGVASLTARYVEVAAGRCRIVDTRKTTPGLRALEKAAVRSGGGGNHRGSLSEMVMLKDNHLAGVAIPDAVATARGQWPHKTIEVECDRYDQVTVAVAAGADAVLLDNMDLAELTRSIEHVRSHAGGPRPCTIEVSGGINLDTLDEIAALEPDLVSVGALTHSAPVLDIGLDLTVEEIRR